MGQSLSFSLAASHSFFPSRGRRSLRTLLGTTLALSSFSGSAYGGVDLIVIGGSEVSIPDIGISTVLTDSNNNLAGPGMGAYSQAQALYFRRYDENSSAYVAITGAPSLTSLGGSSLLTVHQSFSGVVYDRYFNTNITVAPFDLNVLSGGYPVAGTQDTQVVFDATPPSVGTTQVYTVNVPIALEDRTSLGLKTGTTGQSSTVRLGGGLTGLGTLAAKGAGTVAIYSTISNFQGVVDLEAATTLDVQNPMTLGGATGTGEIRMNDSTSTERAVLAFNGALDLTLSPKVTGTSSTNQVSKTGSGSVLVSSGDSTYVGLTKVNQGVWRIGANSTWQGGALTKGPLGVNQAHVGTSATEATLDLNGYTVDNAVYLGAYGILDSSSTTAVGTLQNGTLSITSGARLQGSISSAHPLVIASPIVKAAGTSPIDLNIHKGFVAISGTSSLGGATHIGATGETATLSLRSTTGLGGPGDVKVYSTGTWDLAIPSTSSLSNPLKNAGIVQFDPYAGVTPGSVLTVTLSGGITGIEGLGGDHVGAFYVGPAAQLTLEGIIADYDGTHPYHIHKTGSGELLLKGANTATGQIDISAGTVKIDPLGSLSSAMTLDLSAGELDLSAAGAAVTLALAQGSGGTISLGTKTLIVDDGTSTTPASLGAALSGTGTFHKKGTGPLTMVGNSSGFAGLIEVEDGSTVTMSSTGLMGARSFTGLGTLDLEVGTTVVLTGSSTEPLTAKVTGGGVLQISQAAAGELHITRADNTYSGGTVIATNGTVFVDESSTWDATGGVTQGPLGLGSVQVGTGASLDFHGNTLDNNITLSGTLTNSADLNGTLSSHAQITLASGGAMKSSANKILEVSASIVDPLTPVPLHITGGRVQLLGGLRTFTGGVSIDSGELEIQDGSTLAAGAPFALVSGPLGIGSVSIAAPGTLHLYEVENLYNPLEILGTLKMDPDPTRDDTDPLAVQVNSPGITLSGFGSGFNVGANTVANVTSPLTGTGTLIKSGLGKMVLTNTLNDYSGATAVSEGSLYVVGGALPTGKNVHVAATLDLTAAYADANNSIPIVGHLTGASTGVIKLGDKHFETALSASVSNAASLYGSGGFEVSLADPFAGPFTYTLSGDNSNYTGQLGIGERSVVNISGSSRFSSATGEGDLVIDTGGVLTLKHNSGLPGGHSVLLDPSFIEVDLSGAGLLKIDNTYGTSLYNPSTHTGGVEIISGTTVLHNAYALGTGVTTIKAVGTLDCRGLNLASPNAPSSIVLEGCLKSDNYVVLMAQPIPNTDPVAYEDVSSTLSTLSQIISPITLSGAVANFDGTGNMELQGILSGSAGFTKYGSGTVSLYGVNTYTGATKVSAGDLKLIGTASIASSSNIQVDANFYVSGLTRGYGAPVTLQNLSGSAVGNVNYGSHTLHLSNTAEMQYLGGFTGTGPMLHEGSALTLGGDLSGTSRAFTANGPLTVTGKLAVSLLDGTGTIDLSGSVSELVYYVDSEHDRTLTVPLAGSGSLKKTGVGILDVSANNATWTGSLLVNQGAVRVDHESAVSALSSITLDQSTLDIQGYNIQPPILMKSLSSSSPGSSRAKITNSGDFSVITMMKFFEFADPLVQTEYEWNTDTSGFMIENISITTPVADTWTGVPDKIVKTGEFDAMLGPNVSMPLETAFQIEAGYLVVKGQVEGAITVQQGASVAFTHNSLESRKVFSSAISGAGFLEYYGGWIEHTGIITNTGGLYVSNATTKWEEDLAITTLRVAENFQGTGPIILDGILEARIDATDTIWNNTISGEGVLKKYGLRALTLGGDLSEFTGAMQVLEGTLISNLTWDRDVEVFAGATFISDVHNPVGRASYIQGNLFGAQFSNNGEVYLGNDTMQLQVLSADQIDGDGKWIMQGLNKVRVSASSQNNYLRSVTVASGELALNGLFHSGASYLSGKINVQSQAILSLDPGATYEGFVNVAGGGRVRNMGLNIDRDTTLYWVSLENNAYLDIGTHAINDDPNSYTTRIRTLEMAQGSRITLRPAAIASVNDEPLLEVIEHFNIAQTYESLQSTSFIEQMMATVIMLAPNDVDLDRLALTPATFNLIKLSTDLNANTDQNNLMKSQIVSIVHVSPLFALTNVGFNSDGLLQATISARSVEEIFNDPQFQELSSKSRSLGIQILNNRLSENPFTQSICRLLLESESPSQTRDYLNKISPKMTHQASRAGMIQNAGSAMGTNMMRQSNQSQTYQGLMKSGLKTLSERGLQSQWMGSDLVSRNAALESDPLGGQLRTVQNLGIQGLAFGSDVSYTHQVQKKESEENPGVTQSQWATSVGLTYSENSAATIGVFASSSKTLAHLNANQDNKTAITTDRFNSAGLLWLGQSQQTPLYMAAQASYGVHHYEQERTWEMAVEDLPDVATQATSDLKGYELYGSIEIGYKYFWTEDLVIQPYASGSWNRVTREAYEESSITVDTQESNEYGLSVPKQSQDSQQWSTGLEWIYLGHWQEQGIQLLARTGWTTQKVGGSASLFSYAFQGDLDAVYTESQENKRYNTMDLTVGLNSQLKEGLYISALYTGNYGKYENTHSAMVNVEYVL